MQKQVFTTYAMYVCTRVRIVKDLAYTYVHTHTYVLEFYFCVSLVVLM